MVGEGKKGNEGGVQQSPMRDEKGEIAQQQKHRPPPSLPSAQTLECVSLAPFKWLIDFL